MKLLKALVAMWLLGLAGVAYSMSDDSVNVLSTEWFVAGDPMLVKDFSLLVDSDKNYFVKINAGGQSLLSENPDFSDVLVIVTETFANEIQVIEQFKWSEKDKVDFSTAEDIEGSEYKVWVLAELAEGVETANLKLTVNYDDEIIFSEPDVVFGMQSELSRPTFANTYESDITVTQAGDYRVTLEDVAYPAEFDALGVVVLRGLDVLTQVAAGESAVITLQENDDIRIRLAATPNDDLKVGQFRLTMAFGQDGSGDEIIDVTEFLAEDEAVTGEDPALSYEVVTLDVVAGTYKILAKDLSFPNSLGAVNVAIQSNDGVETLTMNQEQEITLNSAQRISISYFADSNVTGLMTVVLKAKVSNNVIYQATIPVGEGYALIDMFSVAQAQQGSYAIDSIDFNSPSPLASLDVALVRGTNVITSLSGTATSNVDLLPGDYHVYAVANKGNQAGVFGLQLSKEDNVVFEFSEVVGADVIFSEQIEIDVDSTRKFRLKDLMLPAAMQNLGVHVSRGTELLYSVIDSEQEVELEESGNYLVLVHGDTGSSVTTGLIEFQEVADRSEPVVDDEPEDKKTSSGGGFGLLMLLSLLSLLSIRRFALKQ